MTITEFEIIQRFFSQSPSSEYTQLGTGDDAALMNIPANHELVTSIDTMVYDVHFPEKTSAFDLGHKSLAVSLSDMAAMGAEPISVLIALTIPTADEDWLTEYCEGFFQLARQFKTELIGGDLTHGPLTISTTVNGVVPHGKALLRSLANPGDLIFVTGSIGDAGLALQKILNNEKNIEPELLTKLNRPTPRVDIGIKLRDVATAAIDISDGLIADLDKLITASNVGARLEVGKIPIVKGMDWQAALTAGDDYELCFTAPANQQTKIDDISNKLSCAITCIGEVKQEQDLAIIDKDGKRVKITDEGYDHFKN